ncbi:hypothetical protein [Obesumbacterium proteus]|uniref:DNA-damage-inducible protein D n=1 Tax=Obesumbacterium proteus ATCC 12841 TaxID=1354268 RepID=A0AA91IPG6_9GAMM|nr:hypothetical protein [Obesumbacterium proteus]AMO79857.1 hypothetical protein DSM2777_01525 [Obesumbacterium proteus]OAT58839.1 DNA-damage-inducible protein D [Obesumbacterium proteus ATCC 12841]
MALDKKLQMLQQHFDSLAQRTDSDGIEFWFARDLQPHLGYARWENFQTAIIRSVEASRLSGFKELDHFRGATKMVCFTQQKRHLSRWRFLCFNLKA